MWRNMADTVKTEAAEVEEKQGKSTKKKEVLRVIKYALFAASAGIIETVTFTLMNELMDLPYWPCYLTALILSVLWNFTLNRKYTYRAANNVPVAMAKTALFYLIFTPLTTWGGNALSNIGWNHYVILIGTMALNFITEYLYQRFYVFRADLDTNKVAEKAGEQQLSEKERKAQAKAAEAKAEENAETVTDAAVEENAADVETVEAEPEE